MHPQTKPFRARLRSRELLVGTMVTLGSPEVVELLAEIGFDWLFIDAEHSPLEPAQIQPLLQAAGDTPCLVRLVSAEETPIKKALDIGAAGIIAPQVNSAEHAKRVVEYSKYAPMGRRGLGIGRAHCYGLKLREYSQSANEMIAVIVQAEHRDAVADIESIAKLEGVDGVLIGPYDLSASFGRPGEIDHPQVQEAIAHVRATCLAAGLPVGIFGVSADAVRPYIEQGFTLIVSGVDTIMLGFAAKALLKAVKSDPTHSQN